MTSSVVLLSSVVTSSLPVAVGTTHESISPVNSSISEPETTGTLVVHVIS